MILDTCLVSELWRKRPDRGVVGWFDAADESGLFLSVVTLGELAQGASRLADPAHRAAVEERVEAFRRSWTHRLLPVDERVASRWGRLRGEHARAGRVVPVVDALLAATALVHAMPIVTRNVDDFAGLGVDLINPWTGSAS